MRNYKNIQLIFLIIYYVTNLEKTLAENEIIDCSNEELVTSVFNDPIDLTLRGIIKIYENVTISELLTTSNNEFELKYIDARLESNGSNGTEGNGTKNLIIFTTEQFENYAKQQTAARISLKINLGCGMGKERILVFFQPLKEGNYFSPEFSQDRYELLIPTPIFAGFDLTAFLQITAKDDDLTHNHIVFTSNDSSQHHISVGTKNITSDDKKTYFANITLERIYLELPQEIQFEIVATDNGNPPKSSKATVIIRADPNRSLPAQPKFAPTVYKGTIDINFEMEPIHMQLLNGTYSTDLIFSLSGSDIQGYQLVDRKNGSIEIIWNAQQLDTTNILTHQLWELEIKAEHKNLAEISKATLLVELADFQKYFHFMSTYYEGLIDDMGLLQITPIIFNPSIYKTDIDFMLLENPNSYFNLTISSFSIQLQLTTNFNLESIDAKGFLKLPLQAIWKHLSSITYVVIKLPQLKNDNDHLEQMFQFEKPLYVGNLNETYVLELETIILQTDVNRTQKIEYNLSGKGSSFFEIDSNDNQLKLKINTTMELEKFNSSLLLVLKAKGYNRTTYTSVVINVPKLNETAIEKVFQTSFIMGKLLLNDTTQNISMNLIPLNDVENLQNYTFYLRGDQSSNFDVKINFTSHQLELVLKTPITTAILDQKQFINLSVQANSSESQHQNETLLILIELPEKECPVPQTPLPNPPQFSSTNYIFTAFTNQTGSLGAVNAHSKGSNVTLHYILEVQNDILAQRLSINPFTGELMLYGLIEEGNYLFNITAVNVETLEDAHVNGLLKILALEECQLYEGIAVEKTLIIKHIDEERPYYGLLDMQFNENCSFHIEEMWPKDKEYVQINDIFNMLDAVAIDREDPVFENMTEAQILIKLRLKCDKEDAMKSVEIEVPKGIQSRMPEFIYSGDISYSPDIMWLHIIINDINDNSPEFKLSEGPQYLGYPAGSNVDFDIYPQYLTKIEAFDRDLGLNAKIKFSMRDNAHFGIESDTGIIYPKDRMMSNDQQTELIVLAVDQNGEGLISGTVVIVKALTSDFYSLITIKENSTKSIEEMENELSAGTGYRMKIMKMSYIPQISKRSDEEDRGRTCKAWVYAFKTHQLVQCKELQEKLLDKSPDANIVNIESYEEVSLKPTADSSSSNVGYITAVCLLSFISAFSITFIIWRFYCYPKSVNSKCDTMPSATLSTHGNGQHITGVLCSHGADNKVQDCVQCNNQTNHVKFNDLVASVTTVEVCQQK